MNARNVITIYLKELKDTLRDRRALLSMIIIPTLIMPVLVFGVGKLTATIFAKAKQEVAAIAVLGAENSPEVVARLKASDRLRIVPAGPDWKQRVADKQLRAVVQIPAGFADGLKAGSAGDVVIYDYKGEMKSGFAVNTVERVLDKLRDDTAEASLRAHGLPASLIRPFKSVEENVAPPEKVGGNLFGGFVPYIIIILCFTGAMYPAMDLTAGEKERGTMETLLCSPVARVDIVLGKFLMVLTGSLGAMFCTLASLTGTLLAGTMVWGGGSAAAGAAAHHAPSVMPMIDPAGVLGVLAMILPVAVLFSALLFAIALFAKTYKEAQSYLAPGIFIVLMPAMVGMLPGIDLNMKLALVPILNLSLVCKEMLSGVWHWNYIALIFGSTCVYAGVALALAVRMFNRENVIFRV
jgi:sodium transport system permease protein